MALGLIATPLCAAADPYGWLEDIDGEKALRWVYQQNETTAKRLEARPEYKSLYKDALAILNSASRIPEIEAQGKYLYNLWQDPMHPRGLYRRTTADEFRNENPAWETVLDIDALAQAERRPWTFGGAIWLRPDGHRCLIRLAPGGGDASEVREFDAEKRAFLSDGFFVPNAKSRVAWRDADTLYVGTDFGPGTLTESGYPRTIKIWKRGTPLSSATALHETPATSAGIEAEQLGRGPDTIHILKEQLTFWTANFFEIEGNEPKPLAIPATADVVDAFRGRLVIWLKDNWSIAGTTFTAGSVVIADPAALRRAGSGVELIVAGDAHTIVTGVNVTVNGIIVTRLENVRGRLDRYAPVAGGWKREPILFPDNGALKVISTNDDTGEAWVEFESFTIPPTLYHVSAGTTAAEKIKTQAATFNGGNFEVEQAWCASADGTKVPYFVVGPKGMKYDGANPVWMFSYGGFEVALTPAYSGSYEDLHGAYGKLWLERGGVFVLANIRGGGDFGPQWHRAALKENRYKAFEDFEAVARDLVRRKITSPAHLGIEGRSNGGLLVASTMLRHPELYGAVVCGSPLLDMQRYHRLLAGASWEAEYGDPDRPEEWAYIRKYSPYQNLRPAMKLPPVLFYTSTRDDRVHPAHARKMAAKMEAMGYVVDYYENTEGGHHGSVTNEQLATRLARTYTFLWEHVGRQK